MPEAPAPKHSARPPGAGVPGGDGAPPRVAPTVPPHPPEVAEALSRWMPPNAPVEPLALFRTLLRHPALAEAMRPLGSFQLSRRAGLPRRTRELVILRTCARCGCGYEWGVHVTSFATAVGLTPEEVAATAAPSPADGPWSEPDRALLELVDALHDTGRVPDALFGRLAAGHDDTQLLELLVLAGWYHLIAFVANGARVAPEPWAARLPAPA